MFHRRPKEDGGSEKALLEAGQHLHEVKERAGEVTQVATSMRILREKNHFAEQLQVIMTSPRRGIT